MKKIVLSRTKIGVLIATVEVSITIFSIVSFLLSILSRNFLIFAECFTLSSILLIFSARLVDVKPNEALKSFILTSIFVGMTLLILNLLNSSTLSIEDIFLFQIVAIYESLEYTLKSIIHVLKH